MSSDVRTRTGDGKMSSYAPPKDCDSEIELITQALNDIKSPMYVTFPGDLNSYLYPHLTDLLLVVAYVGCTGVGWVQQIF